MASAPRVLSHRIVAAAAALVGVAGLLAIPAGSKADLVSGTVGPAEGFQGEVNGSSVSGATVYVHGPVGHCKVNPGATVNIFTDSTLGGPRTGATDTYVDEYFDAFPSQKIRLDHYGSNHAEPIPTTFDAPCSGEGNAIFKPGPGNDGVADVVHLYFVRTAST